VCLGLGRGGSAARGVPAGHRPFRPSPSAWEKIRWPHPPLSVGTGERGPSATPSRSLIVPSPRDDVRFDPDTGTLWAGDTSLGEVPLGSKEYVFLRCLSTHLDRYVAYADLKREVLRRSGSVDTRDEASFCHRLKNRIKMRFILRIDQFLVTTNKADGYRLVGRGGPLMRGRCP